MIWAKIASAWTKGLYYCLVDFFFKNKAADISEVIHDKYLKSMKCMGLFTYYVNIAIFQTHTGKLWENFGIRRCREKFSFWEHFRENTKDFLKFSHNFSQFITDFPIQLCREIIRRNIQNSGKPTHSTWLHNMWTAPMVWWRTRTKHSFNIWHKTLLLIHTLWHRRCADTYT